MPNLLLVLRGGFLPIGNRDYIERNQVPLIVDEVDGAANGPKLRGTMAKLTSFQTDIRPLFTERDIRAMSKAFDLGKYDDVKAHAGVIYDRIRGIGGAVMPPPPPRGEGPWPQSRIELFATWMSDGYQP